MNARLTKQSAEIRVDGNNHFRLNRARGSRIEIVEGVAWITVDRDYQDYLLQAGESFLVPSNREIFVVPLAKASRLTLNVFRPHPVVSKFLVVLGELTEWLQMRSRPA